MAIQNYTVTRLQTLYDVAIQVYGSTQYLFKLATDNGLQIDSNILVGDVLQYDTTVGDNRVKNRISQNNLIIVNPSPIANAITGAWTDGLGNVFTDGRGNAFTDI